MWVAGAWDGVGSAWESVGQCSKGYDCMGGDGGEFVLSWGGVGVHVSGEENVSRDERV